MENAFKGVNGNNRRVMMAISGSAVIPFISSFLSEACLYSIAYNELTYFSSVCLVYTVVFDGQYTQKVVVLTTDPTT